MELHGVKIGDKFRTGKHISATVVDFWEVKSLAKNEIVKHICVAQAEGLANNIFETPFSTVQRNKIQ
ncbi:MAG: hypothetical protein WC974_08500 [Thermoplasmata archaeon]